MNEGVPCIERFICIVGEVGISMTCDIDGVGGVSSGNSRGCSKTGVAWVGGSEDCSGNEGLIGEGAL